MNARLKRSIASTLIVSITLLPFHSIVRADEMSEAGLYGQSFGEESGGLLSAPPQFLNDKVVFPDSANTTPLDLNALYPGAVTAPSTTSVDSLTGVAGDGDLMTDEGTASVVKLWEDANSGTPSLTGQAYQELLRQVELPAPDLANEPYLTPTREIVENMDLIESDFADCSATTSYLDTVKVNHVPDLKRCNTVIDRTQQCEIVHEYDAGVVTHHAGPYNMRAKDGDTLEVWIGRVGDNYWSGSCSIYEQETQFRIVNKDAIKSIRLVYAKWDDYMQILVGPLGDESKVWSGPNNNFPPETGGACELATDWSVGMNKDITSQVLANLDDNDIVRFKIRVSVSGGGEGYARLEIDYDPDKAITKDYWAPDACISATKGITDGFASGTLSCTSMPTDAGSTGCTYKNGIQICESDLAPSPVPGISNLCEKVAVDVNYDFYKGEVCKISAQTGEEVCFTNGDGQTADECAQYANDASCAFVETECIVGAAANDGTCYAARSTYDCGYNVEINDVTATTDFACAGPIRCMGDDCVNPTKEQSASFSETASLLAAANMMGQDMECIGLDTATTNVSCEIFSGDQKECKEAFFGVQDCCDVPTNVSMGQYLHAVYNFSKLDGAIMEMGDGSLLKGAYTSLREPVMNGVSSVTKPFVSYAENVTGTVSSWYDSVINLKDQAIDQLKSFAQDQLKSIIQSGVQDAGVDAAASAALDYSQAIVENFSAAAGYLMTAYTIYTTAVMVVQIIWKCESEEFELAAQKEVGSCEYVGTYCSDKSFFGCLEYKDSYCCYNSPLARIVSGQLRKGGQLGGYGSPRSPDCGGIALEELSTIDWSQVDLSEWEALLNQYDIIKPPTALDFESLTGSNSLFNDAFPDTTRLAAPERTLERMDGLDIDALNREAYENTAVFPDGDSTN